MRLTLHRYIFREILPVFSASLLVFGLIMVSTRMMSVTEWVVNRGVHPSQVLGLILYVLPGIILFVLPAATLMAVLVAFLRLSADNEIIALNASGISLYQMLPPVLVVSLLSYLLAGFIALFGVPWGNRAFKDAMFKIVESRADVSIKERVFCEPFDDVVFYINSVVPGEKTLRNVFVMDRRDSAMTSTIIAREGSILSRPGSRTIVVRFLEGTVFLSERDYQSVRTVQFESYDLNINLADIMAAVASREKGPKEMYFRDLVAQLNKTAKGTIAYNELLIELWERFSLPLAVFLMGLIGAPLGAQIRSHARSVGISVSLVIFLLYLMFFMGARSLSETGTVSPNVGMWLPDGFLLLCCAYLLRRVARERPIRLLGYAPQP